MPLRVGDLPASTTLTAAGTDLLIIGSPTFAGTKKMTVANFFATIPTAIVANSAVTAAGAVAIGTSLTLTPTAAANNDVLTVLKLTMAAGTPGAFTGLVRQGLAIPAFTVVGDTTPGNPVGISVGVITGTGAAIATALSLASPTGATTNYLIQATNFVLTAAGQGTFGGQIAVQGASVAASAAINIPAGTTGVSSLRIAHGVAPTSPVNGDMWSTTTTLNFQLNGVTKSITMT